MVNINYTNIRAVPNWEKKKNNLVSIIISLSRFDRLMQLFVLRWTRIEVYAILVGKSRILHWHRSYAVKSFSTVGTWMGQEKGLENIIN